jgi:hypothetical protein
MTSAKTNQQKVGHTAKPVCGIVMPISTIDGCSAEHWIDVKEVITESVSMISEPSFEIKMVSDSESAGVIHKRIVQSLYFSEIVICDVSAKNPNVMFELGMRLAFDKPTIVIKDDSTNYSFDTGVIEHISYPRDLRYGAIIEFKEKLKAKVSATYKASTDGDKSISFLNTFGPFQIPQLHQESAPAESIMLSMMQEMQANVERLSRDMRRLRQSDRYVSPKPLRRIIEDGINRFMMSNPSVTAADMIGDDTIAKEIESIIDARLHFESRSDYVNALNSVLLRMVTPK